MRSYYLTDMNNDKISHGLEIPFSKSEYDFAINNMKFKFAPGLDQIDYNIISSLPKSFTYS